MTTQELLAHIDAELEAAGFHMDIEPVEPDPEIDLLPYELWANTHCYSCGRSIEAIIIEGSSPNCLCSDAGFVLSDLELEAGK